MHHPYVLPAFLTAGVFSLELIRQRLTVEEEHFLNAKKGSNISFPWEVGPYTVKSKASLPMVYNLLKGMGFSLEQAIDYDPHQVISKRRKAHKSNPFEHTEILGLREAANWDDFPNSTTMDINIGQSSASPLPWDNSPQMELSKVVAMDGNASSLVSYSGSSMKRGLSKPMETDEVDTTSMPRK